LGSIVPFWKLIFHAGVSKMLTIRKQQSLVYPYVVFVTVGLASTFVFAWLERTLNPFVWPFSPWEHWYGWLAYAIVWIYALIAWAFSWVAQYLMWLSPLAVLGMSIDRHREQRRARDEGYEKIFVFHVRNLVRSWGTAGFGKDQLNAFLNVANLCMHAGIKPSTLQKWFYTGFSQSKYGADELRGKLFELEYTDNGTLVPDLVLKLDGQICLAR
jgi:hypothetical protein